MHEFSQKFPRVGLYSLRQEEVTPSDTLSRYGQRFLTLPNISTLCRHW